MRLPYWDYSNNGAYFVTICTKDKYHFFGEIKQEKMVYTPVGGIAHVLWSELTHRKSNVELGEFIIMPNHMHGILILNNTVETLHATSPQNATSIPHNKMSQISPKKHSISEIIRSYKSAVTKYANRLNLDFAWQSRFHEHIIRNDESFNTISEYIINNPLKWDEDRFYEKDNH